METEDFEFNEKLLKAYDLLENSRNHVFITGQAGTGKSTLLKYFRSHTTKNVVILAPTGVAAVNVKGQTIHSFFRFKPDITPDKVHSIRLRKENREIYRNIDAILIDEVSMVRADLLDCIDIFMRIHGRDARQSFGGTQVILIGDLYQLPPVVIEEEKEIFREFYSSPYFFSAKVFRDLSLSFIDLEKIYRQKDDDFIELLNAIRKKRMTAQQLNTLNTRYQPDFIPDEDEMYVYLTTTNFAANQINQRQLNVLQGRRYVFEGTIEGKFDAKVLPTHEFLELKIGSQVMLLNNDQQGRWINGSIGRVLNVIEDLSATDIIVVELEDGHKVEVTPFTWEMFRFSYNEKTEKMESETVGSFSQYPLKLAWAVTIHKSQGKTFSKVIVDMGKGAFAHGQTYVALSRCISLKGLTLKKPITPSHILLDARVDNFMQRYQESEDVKALP